jgi:hypothetical protein
MIGKKYNYDDVYFRDLIICTLAMLEDRISWVNQFSSGPKEVIVPVYYSVAGARNDDFLLDSFVDDVVGSERKNRTNTDQVPRMHTYMNNWTKKSTEFANPNVWVRMTAEEKHKNKEIRKILTKIRAIPIKASFKSTLILNSELDVWKASEAIMNALTFYDHMYFEHNFIRIDAVATFPDDEGVEISREIGMEGSDLIKLNFDFEVDTYYPAATENQKIGRPVKSKWINQLKEAQRQDISDLATRDKYSNPDINQAST